MDISALYARGDKNPCCAPLVRAYVDELPLGRARLLCWGADSLDLPCLNPDMLALAVCYDNDRERIRRYREKYADDDRFVFMPIAVPGGASGPYIPSHPYVTDALRRFGDDSFDMALVGGSLYRSDCLDLCAALVKDGGLILIPGLLSFVDAGPDLPGRRYLSAQAGSFPELLYFDEEPCAVARNRKTSEPYADSPGIRKKYQRLKAIFTDFARQGIDHVVLRNNGAIPAFCSREDDIDILIRPEDYARACDIVNFPGRAVVRDSAEYQQLYGACLNVHLIDPKLDLMVDMHTALQHHSLMGNMGVTLCDYLQRSMFDRRRFAEGVVNAVPGYADLFIHISCRAVFDARRTTPRYARQLELLLPVLDKEALREELALVFFKFAPKLLDLVEQGKADRLFSAYMSFNAY